MPISSPEERNRTLPLLESSLTGLTGRLQPDHLLMAEAMQRLAILHEKADRPDKAQKYLQKVLTLRGESLGREHPLVVAAARDLAQFFERRRQDRVPSPGSGTEDDDSRNDDGPPPGDTPGAAPLMPAPEHPETAAGKTRDPLAEARRQAELEAEKRKEAVRLEAEREAAQRRQANREAAEKAAREAVQREAAERAAREAAERKAREAAQREAAEKAARETAEREARQRETAERNEKIQGLLTAAARDIRSDRLSRPAGNNAIGKYRQILILDPGNAQALQGLKKVADRYAHLAGIAMKQRRWRRAGLYLKRGGKIDPESSAIQQMRSRYNRGRGTRRR